MAVVICFKSRGRSMSAPTLMIVKYVKKDTFLTNWKAKLQLGFYHCSHYMAECIAARPTIRQIGIGLIHICSG